MNFSLLRGKQASPVFYRCESSVLVCSCVCGLLLGVLYSQGADDSYFLLMRTAAASRVSIVGLLTSLYLPFLIAAFFAFIMQPQLMLILCFCKAFIFSCCGYAAISAFGTAGWLVRILLQFSDCCIIPFFFWFCLRNVSGSCVRMKRDLLFCSLVTLSVVAFDFCVISPFLVKLIDI